MRHESKFNCLEGDSIARTVRYRSNLITKFQTFAKQKQNPVNRIKFTWFFLFHLNCMKRRAFVWRCALENRYSNNVIVMQTNDSSSFAQSITYSHYWNSCVDVHELGNFINLNLKSLCAIQERFVFLFLFRVYDLFLLSNDFIICTAWK